MNEKISKLESAYVTDACIFFKGFSSGPSSSSHSIHVLCFRFFIAFVFKNWVSIHQYRALDILSSSFMDHVLDSQQRRSWFIMASYFNRSCSWITISALSVSRSPRFRLSHRVHRFSTTTTSCLCIKDSVRTIQA